MADGHHFKGYLPGGASGGILPAYMADIPLDFGQLEKHGCFVGSHAVVILSDKDDMKAVALNLMRFFEDESCGQCTPCRNGTEKAVKLMSAGNWDAELLADLAQVMADASICGLGQAAPNPLKCVFKYLPGGPAVSVLRRLRDMQAGPHAWLRPAAFAVVTMALRARRRICPASWRLRAPGNPMPDSRTGWFPVSPPRMLRALSRRSWHGLGRGR